LICFFEIKYYINPICLFVWLFGLIVFVCLFVFVFVFHFQFFFFTLKHL